MLDRSPEIYTMQHYVAKILKCIIQQCLFKEGNFSIKLQFHFITHSPGGELNPGEDEVEGLKRLMTEVLMQ